MKLNLPGYRISDYMLVLDPGTTLSERLLRTREEFNTSFLVDSPPYKPNLLLASFKQYVIMEERIVNRLNVMSMGQCPFKVELNGFGGFPSHSIYVAVTSKIPIQSLVKKIRSEAGIMMKRGEDKPYFGLEPHFVIGRKLKPWQYEKAWLEYSKKHFSGRFIAEEMLLLKRMEGEVLWQVARHFRFQNLPVETKQAQLF